MPRLSKVMRVSIVAMGSPDALEDFLEEANEAGENADVRI